MKSYTIMMNSNSNSNSIKFYINIALCLAFFLQTFIQFSITNISCSFLSLIISLTILNNIIKYNNFIYTPLQCISIIGFNFSIFSGPLIIKSLEFEPIIYNLQSPYSTFFFSFLFQLTLLFSFYVYKRYFFNKSKILNIRVFLSNKFRAFYIPNESEVWKIGLLSLISILILPKSFAESLEASRGILIKFIAGFGIFTYFPFVLPILTIITNKKNSTYLVSRLIFYTLLILIMAVIQNSRGAIFIGVFSLFLNFLVLFLQGKITFSKKIIKKLFILLLLVFILLPQVSDLAIAMVNARGARSEATSLELISETFNQFSDKNAIENTRLLSAVLMGEGYSETYVKSPLLSRLIQIKFFDNVFTYESVLSASNSKLLQRDLFIRIVGLLPAPIIDFFGFNINKDDIKFSTGDILYSLDNGGFHIAYLTGSTVGHGVATFGYLFYFIVIPIVIIFFIILEVLYSYKNDKFLICPIILISIYQIFSIFTGDSIFDMIAFFTRTIPQNIFLYFLLLVLFSSRKKINNI